MKTILVLTGDGKEFRITVPDDARMTYGPFSPPAAKGQNGGYGESAKAVGTLRVYQGEGTKNILGVWSNVTSFRDVALDFEEKVATEEVSTMWKSDRHGYRQESSHTKTYDWGGEDDDAPAQLAPPETPPASAPRKPRQRSATP